VGCLDTAGEPAGEHAGCGGAEQEEARLAAGEAAHLVEEVGRLAVLQHRGEALDRAGRLLEQVTRRSGGALAGAVGERADLLRERGQALPGLLLLRDDLRLDLGAALVQEVLGLSLRLRGDFPGLLARGGCDLAAGLRGRLPDVLGLAHREVLRLLGALRRRRRRGLGGLGGRRGTRPRGGGGREWGVDAVSHRSSSALIVVGCGATPQPIRHTCRWRRSGTNGAFHPAHPCVTGRRGDSRRHGDVPRRFPVASRSAADL
jgi:hypothetical protein